MAPRALAALLLFLACGSSSAQSGRAACAAKVEGQATRVLAGTSTPQPLKTGALLAYQDSIQVASNGSVSLLFLATKKTVSVPGGTRAEVASLATDALIAGPSAGPRAAFAGLLSMVSVPQLQPEHVFRSDVPRTVRGRRRGWVELLYPRNTKFREAAPLFRWAPVAGAQGYEISIFSSTLDAVVDRERVSTPSFAYRSELVSLQPGRPYFWQVRALGIGRRPGALVYCQLLDPQHARTVEDSVEAARRNSRAASMPAATEALLVAGVLGDHGLYGEALAILEEAAQLQPDNEVLQEAVLTVSAHTGRLFSAHAAAPSAR